jgi:hypothetical protein
VSPDVLQGNPHADGFGNEGVWHFYTEPVSGETGPVIPANSLLTKWQSAATAEEKERLADEVQKLLTSGPPEGKDNPDAALHRQLTSMNGPLIGQFLRNWLSRPDALTTNNVSTPDGSPIGLDRAQFGKHPDGTPIDAASLAARAPAVIEIRLPTDLVAGCELVTTGSLDSRTGAEGSNRRCGNGGQRTVDIQQPWSLVRISNYRERWQRGAETNGSRHGRLPQAVPDSFVLHEDCPGG